MLAARLVVGAREQHAGQLALGAGRGVQRDVREAGDLGQRALELPHQLQRALGAGRAPAAGAGGRGPGSAATRSCSFGLCFIVHDPSG